MQWHIQIIIHSPPTKHSNNHYALKPVLSATNSIRSTQLQAVGNIDTAAKSCFFVCLVHTQLSRGNFDNFNTDGKHRSTLNKFTTGLDTFYVQLRTKNF